MFVLSLGAVWQVLGCFGSNEWREVAITTNPEATTSDERPGAAAPQLAARWYKQKDTPRKSLRLAATT